MSHNHKLNCSFLRHVNLPSNLGSITNPSGRALGVGQCGDSIEVMLRLNGEEIAEIRCQPRGCAFTIACASAISELAEKRTLEQALEITTQEVEAKLGGLPEDHLHCARLAVNTLGEAIADCYRQQRALCRQQNSPKEEERSDADIRGPLP